MGHRLGPFLDRIEGFLNPTIKGTVSENLTFVGMQCDVFEGEECWLAKDVLDRLEEFLVRTGNYREQGRVQAAATFNALRKQDSTTNLLIVVLSSAHHRSLSGIATL